MICVSVPELRTTDTMILMNSRIIWGTGDGVSAFKMRLCRNAKYTEISGHPATEGQTLMSAPIKETEIWDAAEYDMIIDVRAPVEFADDHIPGAINLPVLSNEERVIIGTLYKQESPFIARKKGAALVARNIATHIDTVLHDKPTDFTPLIHCWRGGQRSHSFAQICSAIGWRSYVLKGGYKFYRRAVLAQLQTLPPTLNLIIIAGRTGSRKTDILTALAAKGAQVLDLEGLASHRGSLLGRVADTPQPSQRMFETAVNAELERFDQTKPVFVESESSRIGNVQLPAELWKQMTKAPQIPISAPREARAQYLLKGYAHLTEDITDLDKLIAGMTRRHGHERTSHWRSLIDANAWGELAYELLEAHYDPAYDTTLQRHQRPVLGEVTQTDCSDEALAKTVDAILNIQNASPLSHVG